MRNTREDGSGTWCTLYHTNNKPTPADIGAVAKADSINYLLFSILDNKLQIFKLNFKFYREEKEV